MKAPIFRRSFDYLKKKYQAYRDRGVFGYLWWSAIKIVTVYTLTIIPIILILKHYLDLNSIYRILTENLSDPFVLVTFFLSESFLGLIPPDIFMIWTIKFNSPLFFLFLLGVLSYSGGIMSYFIGNWLSKRRRIREFSERKLDRYIKLVRKWGGAFIIIAALFPYSPFSMVVIATSLLKYPFRLYLLFGISRILRFVIQGIFYLKIMNLDNYFT